MENNTNRDTDQNSHIVNKIASGKQASYTDEPLTPPRKMEAEQMRMRNKKSGQEDRQEEDTQVTNLGGSILTPQKKMERDRPQAREEHRERR